MRAPAGADNRIDRDGCDCPPPWLPLSPDGRVRVVRCWHCGGEALRLFRHFDLPSLFMLELRLRPGEITSADLFLDYETGLIFFEEKKAELMGRA